ncbi:MAG: hypothetical protein JNL72_12995 [Flavipsychrobacter sp.]|nr:hypothetical protein [Flavipsychrobacter sp.]
MKIAILILAHKNPGQLRLLVNRLKQDFEVYLHFDTASSISSEITEEEHVHILQQRYRTSWGSFNIVLAELELLRSALSHNCDYYMLISGQDLPIKSNKAIATFVEQHYADHIECHPLPLDYWGAQGGLERMTLYWESTAMHDTVINLPVRAAMKVVRGVQKILGLKRKVKSKLYGGSQWFNLTRETVKSVLSFIDENPWFLKQFHHSRASDELFIQTAVMHVAQTITNSRDSRHYRYFDWKTGPTYPRILSMNDYQSFMSSENLFARKFDEKVESTVIHRVMMETNESLPLSPG